MLLRVVAIRHAKPQIEGFADEAFRRLSQEGIGVQHKMSQYLKGRAIVPSLIYASPLVRARETAEIISSHFDNVPIISLDALGYDFDSKIILSLLPDPIENKTIYLVGHNPTLGEFVNQLVGEIVLPTGLSKSSAAVVDFRAAPVFGAGVFTGYYTPDSV